MYLRRRTCGFALCRVLEGAHYRGAASQASVLACVVLARTSERLAGPSVLEGALVDVVAPSDLAGSIIVKILNFGEGGDVA